MTKSFPALSRDVGIRTICVICVPLPADSRDVACRVSPFNPLYATGICSVGQSLRTVRRGTPRLYKAAHCLLTTTTPSVFIRGHPSSSVSSVCSYLRTVETWRAASPPLVPCMPPAFVQLANHCGQGDAARHVSTRLRTVCLPIPPSLLFIRGHPYHPCHLCALTCGQ